MLMLLNGFSAYGQPDIYTHYAPCSGLNVGYFKDFRVDSILSVTATIIIAKDSDAWEWMKKEFCIKELSDQDKMYMSEGKLLKNVRVRKKSDILHSIDEFTEEKCIQFTLYNKRCVIVFDAETEEQFDLILYYLVSRK